MVFCGETDAIRRPVGWEAESRRRALSLNLRDRRVKEARDDVALDRQITVPVCDRDFVGNHQL